MQENYQVVPNMISGKDLDYLSDMFEWNIGAYKKVSNCIKKVEQTDIKEMLEKAIKMFNDHTQIILNILNQGGSNE